MPALLISLWRSISLERKIAAPETPVESDRWSISRRVYICLRVEGFYASDGYRSFRTGTDAHVDVGAVLCEASDSIISSVI